MNSTLLWPAVIMGVLAGWIARDLAVTGSLIPTPTLFGAMVTIGVGWFLQRALRTQAELQKIPIDSLAKLTERVDSRVVACLEAAGENNPLDSGLLTAVRDLSNEVDWLTTFLRMLMPDDDAPDRILAAYVEYKTSLTGSAQIDEVAAPRSARVLRILCLQAS